MRNTLVNASLKEKIILLDGALGTELQRRGVPLPLPLWSAEANLTRPEIVASIHRDYVEAGAQVLTTNTFRTTSWTYVKAGYSLISARQRARESLLQAVTLARRAATSNTTIAGSLAPMEDCYQPDAFPGELAAGEVFEETMTWFQEAGVDLLLIETMGNIDEITVALQVVKRFPFPVWLSLILKDSSHLLDGSPLQKATDLANKNDVHAVLLNCNSVQLTQAGIQALQACWSGFWGVYPNLGATPIEPDGTITAAIPREVFRRYVRGYITAGARVLGSCCGSTPEHTRMLRRLIDKMIK